MKYKVGDKVRINELGLRRYPYGYDTRIYTLEKSVHEGEGLCIFCDSRGGWIHEGMGLYKYIDRVIYKNVLGGKLL